MITSKQVKYRRNKVLGHKTIVSGDGITIDDDTMVCVGRVKKFTSVECIIDEKLNFNENGKENKFLKSNLQQISKDENIFIQNHYRTTYFVLQHNTLFQQ